jgi:hypothetical protein
MSRWSTGNFDDDMAPELLMEIAVQLIDRIHKCLDIDTGDNLFCGETEVMPAIDILVTLGRAYPDILQTRLQEQPVATWKAIYLRMFKEQSDFPEDEFQLERMAVIAETFDNLEKLL